MLLRAFRRAADRYPAGRTAGSMTGSEGEGSVRALFDRANRLYRVYNLLRFVPHSAGLAPGLHSPADGSSRFAGSSRVSPGLRPRCSVEIIAAPYALQRSILELVRTPVVKQSLLRGTAHFAPPFLRKELGEESPRENPKRRRSRTDACPAPIQSLTKVLRNCKPKAMPREEAPVSTGSIRNWCGDNFKFFFGGL